MHTELAPLLAFCWHVLAAGLAGAGQALAVLLDTVAGTGCSLSWEIVQNALCNQWYEGQWHVDPTGVWRQGSLVQGGRWVWQHIKTGAAQLQDAVLAILQIPNMREVRCWAGARHVPATPQACVTNCQ